MSKQATNGGRQAEACTTNGGRQAEACTTNGGSGTEAEWQEARERGRRVEGFLEAQEQGYSARQAAAAVGMSLSQVERLVARYGREGLAGLLPRRREAGRPAAFALPVWFVPAARFFYLLSNRTVESGSVPEAIRRTISLPVCPGHLVERLAGVLKKQGIKLAPPVGIGLPPLPVCPAELREMVLARERAGKPMVPARVARLIRTSGAVVRAFRNPTEFRLDHLTTTGTQRLHRNECGDFDGFLQAGDLVEPDDGTINFAVAVPWQFPGNKCADKWGCIVGRFQLLLMVDAATSFIPSFVYVIRPRSSYRQEDVVWSYLQLCKGHGIPRGFRHEGGAWAGNRALDCLRLSGVKAVRAYGPRSKAFVEGMFNNLWTKLSVTCPGQVGRNRGEMEDEQSLIQACRSGAQNPREHFPELGTALEAITAAVIERNGTPMRTDFGSWVPAERWTEQLEARPLRRLEPETEWMFAPVCEERTVRKAFVRVGFPLIEDCSIPYDFTCEGLAEMPGAKVKVYFNPWAGNRVSATIALAEAHGELPAGHIVGSALQINATTDYLRSLLELGNGADTMGKQMKQRAYGQVRREARAIVGSGRVGPVTVEARDGVGRAGEVVVEGQAEACTTNGGRQAEACTTNRGRMSYRERMMEEEEG